jgi:hypothetical protein
MTYLDAVISHVWGNIPGLIAWLVGIVLAALMIKRGGGKAEKFLLAGCSLMFTAHIVSPLLSGLLIWMMGEQRIDRMSSANLAIFISLPMSILSMAGIICLLYAFWTRWKTTQAVQT